MKWLEKALKAEGWEDAICGKGKDVCTGSEW